jgi:flagellar biosynthesis/type III secretory pathway M-ring protein FliF/YscJ
MPDEFVKVAYAQNQAEAELIQGLLRNEGVPSFVRRSAGADVPDFLAAGGRDVLVPASMADFARELLAPQDRDPDPGDPGPDP